MSRWDKAVHSIERLNSLDLNYPTLGVNLLRQTVNSNSAFRTFGEIMDVDIPDFPAKLEPGLDNRMLPIDVIEKKIKYRPVQGKSASLTHDMQNDLEVLRAGASSLHGFSAEQKENIASGLLAACVANNSVKRVDSTILGNPLPDGSQNLIARYSPWGNAGPHFSANVDIAQGAATPAQQHLDSVIRDMKHNQSLVTQQQAQASQHPLHIV